MMFYFRDNIYKGGLPWWLSGKESDCNTGDVALILGSGRSPWRRKWQPMRCSFLGNPVDRGAWRATVHGVTKESDMIATKQPQICKG